MKTATGESVRYVVDPRASQFTVQSFANGLISAVAPQSKDCHPDWSGIAEFAPSTLRDARFQVSVKAASLNVLDDMRDDDRREIHRVMNSGSPRECTFSGDYIPKHENHCRQAE
jgi:hypothetical protein